jgi:hypothetical protein
MPLVQHLQGLTPKISRMDGVHALVIVPTREVNVGYLMAINTPHSTNHVLYFVMLPFVTLYLSVGHSMLRDFQEVGECK